jgi:hypothetical protein
MSLEEYPSNCGKRIPADVSSFVGGKRTLARSPPQLPFPVFRYVWRNKIK